MNESPKHYEEGALNLYAGPYPKADLKAALMQT